MNVEPLDIDHYFEFGQDTISPTSSSSKGKAIQTPEFHTPAPTRPFLAQPDGRSVFSGPSHQYDQHTQQTGLPSGALANALAANQNTAFHQGGYTNTQTFAGSNIVDFDFNATMPTFNPSFQPSADIEMDFDSPTDGFFPSDSDYVDPNAIGGHEQTSPQPARSEVVRLWPGMHTQQAEIAKQQQQQEIQRQQQIKAATQQIKPASGHKRNVSSRTGASANKPTDPVVEERISRLLNQMRNGSVASTEDGATPQPSHSQSHRTRKEEEDMDEDERLLASEEGKKLTSKERRQLRNKVSARAFRSRRKEYIGQLEGELTIKAQECDDLHLENVALKSENTRLTDLSKMLLASPAFSAFLADISASGVPSSLGAIAPQQQQTSQQQHIPKAVNSSQHPAQVQHNAPQIGMALIPEPSMDFLEPANGNWNTGMDYGFSSNTQQVFAVTELPQGPPIDSLDSALLSGKSSNFVPSFSSDIKIDRLVHDVMPTCEIAAETIIAPTCNEDEEFDETDPAFALFVDSPAISKAPVEAPHPEYQLFGEIRLEKAFSRIEFVSEYDNANSRDVSTSTMARFESICSSLDTISCRVASHTAHL